MENAKYPATPTKPRGNSISRSCAESPVNTPQNNAYSTHYIASSGEGVKEQLPSLVHNSTNKNRAYNKILRPNKKLYHKNKGLHRENAALKDMVDQLTAADGDLNLKSHSGEKPKSVKNGLTTYNEDHKSNVDNLAMGYVGSTMSIEHYERGGFEDLRNQVSSLQAQTQDLKGKLANSHLRCQLLEAKLYAPDAQLQKSLQALEMSQGEAQTLRNQVKALQKEMLAQISKVEVISDETFSRDFHTLASLVKSLSRSVQPAHDSDLMSILGTSILLTGVVKQHWDTRARKKVYVEAWVWSVLISLVFDNPFGFYKRDSSLNKNWKFIFGNSHEKEWPIPTRESENWRLVTVEKLLGQIGRATVTSGQVHEEYRRLHGTSRHLQHSVLEMRESIANFISILPWSTRKPIFRISRTLLIKRSRWL